MKEARYSILFDGVILAGMPENSVKANLMRLLDCDAEHISTLLLGRENAILKSGLSLHDADRFVQEMRRAGAMARKVRDVAKDTSLLQTTPELALLEEPALDHPAPVTETGLDANNSSTVNPLESPSDFWSKSNGASKSEWRASPMERTQDPVLSDAADHCELEYFSLQGRLGRIRYFGWGFGAMVLLGIITALTTAQHSALFALIVACPIIITCAVFFISLTVRRLHDLNLSGWWMFLLFLPVVPAAAFVFAPSLTTRFVLLLCLLAHTVFNLFLNLKSGSVYDNDYGPPPPPNTAGVTLLAIICIVLYVYGLVNGWNNREQFSADSALQQMQNAIGDEEKE